MHKKLVLCTLLSLSIHTTHTMDNKYHCELNTRLKTLLAEVKQSKDLNNAYSACRAEHAIEPKDILGLNGELTYGHAVRFQEILHELILPRLQERFEQLQESITNQNLQKAGQKKRVTFKEQYEQNWRMIKEIEKELEKIKPAF